MRKTWIVLLVVVIAIILYAGTTLWLAGNETELIYQPVAEKLTEPTYSDLDIKRIELTTSDSVQLVGWEIAAPQNDSLDTWLIYFHDRGQTVASNLEEYLFLRGMGLNILAIDYRGFGESEGESTEEGLGLDGKACHYHIRFEKEIPSKRIIMYGVGLGAAVMFDVALDVNAAAVVAIDPYLSTSEMVHNRYPLFPVSWFVDAKFNSLERIPKINTPKLLVPPPTDTGIENNDALQLFDAASKYKTLFKWKEYFGNSYNHSFYTELSRLLVANSPVGLSLKTPPLPLADSLLVNIENKGIDNTVKLYQKIKASDSTNYDMSEYQLDRLGNILLNENRIQEAVEILRLYVNSFPNSFYAHNQLARALMKSGNSESAKRHLRLSLGLKPDKNPASELLQNVEL